MQALQSRDSIAQKHCSRIEESILWLGESIIMAKPLSWNEYVRLCLSFAVFTRNEDTGWTVEIPVLPGCVSWGDTRADAAIMAEDAIHGWLVTALRFGDDVPEIDGNGLGYLAKMTSDSELIYA